MHIARGLVTAALVAAVSGGACGGAPAKPDGGGGRDGGGTAGVPAIRGFSTSGTVSPTASRDVDVLFVIDNAPSMALMQAKLASEFPAMLAALRAALGEPNIHVAIVSSDMGDSVGTVPDAGASTPGCSAAGQAGKFQNAARGSCTATNLQAGATFISSVNGVANFSGDIADVFRCIAPLGESGCGFQQPFAAMTRALGADGRGGPPIENQGFLRPDALLTIVMLTNKDDCSVAEGVPLFDTTQNKLITSQLGPLTNFRCNEFGHICDGGPPNRNAPRGMVTDTVPYQNCVSAESSGLLKTVTDSANQIKALKSDPAKQIVMVSIQAQATPYQVHWRTPSLSDTGPWPEITHSCVASDLSFGDPGVRTLEFALQFGLNGLSLPICNDSFAPVMNRVGEVIVDASRPPCIPNQVARTSGTRPECNVIAHTGNGSGQIVDSVVPYCGDMGGTAPCWSLVGLAGCAGATLNILPDPANPMPASLTYTYQCGLCTTGVSEPARGCP